MVSFGEEEEVDGDGFRSREREMDVGGRLWWLVEVVAGQGRRLGRGDVIASVVVG